MCQQGLLNVYALADPLVEQDNKHFMTTIQVGGWVGGQRSTGCLRVAARRALWGVSGGGSPSVRCRLALWSLASPVPLKRAGGLPHLASPPLPIPLCCRSCR
jgi:hypothetical protein